MCTKDKSVFMYLNVNLLNGVSKLSVADKESCNVTSRNTGSIVLAERVSFLSQRQLQFHSGYSGIPSCPLQCPLSVGSSLGGGQMAERLGHWAIHQKVVGSIPGRAK